MKFDEFKAAVKDKYAENFRGVCAVRKYVCLGKSIVIDCYLAEEQSGTISDNDMFHVAFNIALPDNFDYNTDELPERMTLESWYRFYLLKPEDKYFAFDSRKIPYRKTSGTAEKLAQVLGKFFDRMAALIAEDVAGGKIHKYYEETVKKNVINKCRTSIDKMD